ncbi:WGR domain-containing protein [Nocardiopsis rhodophaea]
MSNRTIDPRTYLELSQEGDGAHKFYEVVIEGTEVAIRYGRIGETGQKRTASYATPAIRRSRRRSRGPFPRRETSRRPPLTPSPHRPNWRP